MQPVLSKLESLLSQSLAAENVELVDLTYQKEGGQWILRVFLDKPGGFNLNDCEVWSDKIGTLLDQEDLVPHAFNLEISSPGIYRVLKKIADFQRFAGQRVKIRLFGPIEGMRNVSGTLIGTLENDILVELEDKRRLKLPHEQIAKAHLDPVIDF